jgi:hypothetical protein
MCSTANASGHDADVLPMLVYEMISSLLEEEL